MSYFYNDISKIEVWYEMRELTREKIGSTKNESCGRRGCYINHKHHTFDTVFRGDPYRDMAIGMYLTAAAIGLATFSLVMGLLSL
jgi:hypothetical protein